MNIDHAGFKNPFFDPLNVPVVEAQDEGFKLHHLPRTSEFFLYPISSVTIREGYSSFSERDSDKNFSSEERDADCRDQEDDHGDGQVGVGRGGGRQGQDRRRKDEGAGDGPSREQRQVQRGGQNFSSLQGDTEGWPKPPFDFKTKVPFLPGLAWPSQAKAELVF